MARDLPPAVGGLLFLSGLARFLARCGAAFAVAVAYAQADQAGDDARRWAVMAVALLAVLQRTRRVSLAAGGVALHVYALERDAGILVAVAYLGIALFPALFRPRRRQVVREELRAFYREHNPAKLRNVDRLLDRYAGMEDVLMARLRSKYSGGAGGATPTPTTPAPGQSPVESELQSPVESEMQSPIDSELQSPIDSGLQSPADSELQSPMQSPPDSPQRTETALQRARREAAEAMAARVEQRVGGGGR